MDTSQFKELQAKLESIWNEDSLIINDAPVEEAAVDEAVKGPGVDAINDLLDMGVSK